MSKHRKKRPAIKCPICGQKMKRITHTHLRAKHNMTMEQFHEQYGAIVARDVSDHIDFSDPAVVQDLSDEIVKYIVSDEKISSVAQQVIQNLLKDHEGALRVTLNMVAVMRIEGIQELYKTMLEIRRHLFDSRRMANMSVRELQQTFKIAEKSFESSLNYLKSLSTDKDKKTSVLFEQNTQVINIFEQDPEAPEAPESPRSRDKLRQFWDALSNAAARSEPKEIEGRVVSREPSDGQEKEKAQAPDEETDGGSSSENRDVS